ncbi:hypothetical protein FDP41_013551 [Naegleria fowleri]|uniref:Dickkopf N-terminal cysteine-rich domain-containing protein n=1 Tax=Naegleria fowleri TaxID=5763 RepID=A0A6A5BT30_NAEFO|nr:uncharacterized protein FDP41_013551 [Naegleria fowleri]KAF0980337.1 hypothetical protein FDP41_013551 [Naegleria fowleri]CAG4711074.1 unnamed protein product [Naegleria fowleri]
MERIQAQTCTANAGSTPTSANYLCPLGYINTKTSATTFECKKVTDMQSSVLKQKACQTSADCAININDDTNAYSSKLLVTCYVGQCVYLNTRLPGDSCSWGGQCLGGRCDLLTGRCVSTSLNIAKKDQRCGVSNEGLTINCNTDSSSDALQCLTDVTIGSTSYNSCYAKKMVKVGDSCTTWDNTTRLYNVCEDPTTSFCNTTLKTCVALLEDGSPCSAHSQCKNGDCQLNNPNDPNSGRICKKLKTYGEACESNMECSNLYTCRSTDSKSSRRCLPFAELGEFCNIDTDCRYNTPFVFDGNTVVNNLVVCSNSKCIRTFGQANGQRCEQNAHCYTGYCDQQTGNCANPPLQKCTVSNNVDCPYCACKDGTNGVCVNTNNCPGYKLDLHICIYNNFVTSLKDPYASSYFNLANRLAMDTLFVDRDSSIYTKCRSYFTNYWSCMQNNDKWTVAEFEGFVPGVQPVPNLIMPKVLSGAPRLVSTNRMILLFAMSLLVVMLVTLF